MKVTLFEHQADAAAGESLYPSIPYCFANQFACIAKAFFVKHIFTVCVNCLLTDF
jgi:hypothetical protein